MLLRLLLLSLVTPPRMISMVAVVEVAVIQKEEIVVEEDLDLDLEVKVKVKVDLEVD